MIGKNQAYGALALPLALLVWILYLMTRIIMLIAAWAKEATLDHEARLAEHELAAGDVPPAAVLPRRSAPAPNTCIRTSTLSRSRTAKPTRSRWRPARCSAPP